MPVERCIAVWLLVVLALPMGADAAAATPAAVSTSAAKLSAPEDPQPADAHLRLAGALVEAAGGQWAFDNSVRQAIAGMDGRLQALAERFPVGSADYLAVQRYSGHVRALVAEELSWRRLKSRYVQLYADTYSDDEMRELIAFYRTDTGAMLRRKQPQLIVQAAQLVADDMQHLMPMIAALTQQLQEQLRADHVQP